jgi:hypothetical protein
MIPAGWKLIRTVDYGMCHHLVSPQGKKYECRMDRWPPLLVEVDEFTMFPSLILEGNATVIHEQLPSLKQEAVQKPIPVLQGVV